MVIYIQSKFHQIPSTGYLVMAPNGCDEQTKWPTDMQKTIPPPSAGGANFFSKLLLILSTIMHSVQFSKEIWNFLINVYTPLSSKSKLTIKLAYNFDKNKIKFLLQAKLT